MSYRIENNKPFGVILHANSANDLVQDINKDLLVELFDEHSLVVLRGFKNISAKEDFETYCDSFGQVALWPFGKTLELIEQENPKDHIFDNNYVPLHWDGMYRKQVPKMQIFQCVSAPGTNNGGRTTFTHTNKIINKMDEKLVEEMKKAVITYERKMEFYDSKTIAPLICTHPERHYPVIRYCEPPRKEDQDFLNHPGFNVEGVSDIDNFIEKLNDTLYSSENLYAHDWETGDIVLSDNYTLLHGREAFTSGAPRHLRRVQILGAPALDNPHLEYTR